MRNRHTNRSFTLAEAEGLLEIIGRIQPIVVVPASPYLKIPWPHICWLTTPDDKLGALNSVAWKFEGNARWYLIADLPRTCLVAEALEQNATTDSMGLALSDLPKLAQFLEVRLGLSGKKSLGHTFLADPLELPLIYDRLGSGRPVIVVADPEKYRHRQGIPTSELDRTIHFWITDEEYDALYSTLEALHRPETASAGEQYHLLWEIASNYYGDVSISSDQVNSVISECKQLGQQQPLLNAALEKIALVSQSANNYNLAIYIPGG